LESVWQLPPEHEALQVPVVPRQLCSQPPPAQVKVQLAEPVQDCWQLPPSQSERQVDWSLHVCSQFPFLQENEQLSLPVQLQLDPEQALSSPPQPEITKNRPNIRETNTFLNFIFSFLQKIKI